MPKRPPGPPKDISRQQLHMLARAVLLADPTIGSGEWKERIYDRLITFGFRYPRPDQLSAAMNNVEGYLEKKFGPRPVDRRTP